MKTIGCSRTGLPTFGQVDPFERMRQQIYEDVERHRVIVNGPACGLCAEPGLLLHIIMVNGYGILVCSACREGL